MHRARTRHIRDRPDFFLERNNLHGIHLVHKGSSGNLWHGSRQGSQNNASMPREASDREIAMGKHRIPVRQQTCLYLTELLQSAESQSQKRLGSPDIFSMVSVELCPMYLSQGSCGVVEQGSQWKRTLCPCSTRWRVRNICLVPQASGETSDVRGSRSLPRFVILAWHQTCCIKTWGGRSLCLKMLCSISAPDTKGQECHVSGMTQGHELLFTYKLSAVCWVADSKVMQHPPLILQCK